MTFHALTIPLLASTALAAAAIVRADPDIAPDQVAGVHRLDAAGVMPPGR
ncbi:MAG: hypothetical protein MZV65_13435 [Chromatiales bacterium]|nr:hypothetical protein [Chromatiales bacterium]